MTRITVALRALLRRVAGSAHTLHTIERAINAAVAAAVALHLHDIEVIASGGLVLVLVLLFAEDVVNG